MTDDAKLIERLLDRIETLLGENARLVGIIELMTAANAMTQERRRDIGPSGPDPFGGRFK